MSSNSSKSRFEGWDTKKLPLELSIRHFSEDYGFDFEGSDFAQQPRFSFHSDDRFAATYSKKEDYKSRFYREVIRVGGLIESNLHHQIWYEQLFGIAYEFTKRNIWVGKPVTSHGIKLLTRTSVGTVTCDPVYANSVSISDEGLADKTREKYNVLKGEFWDFEDQAFLLQQQAIKEKTSHEFFKPLLNEFYAILSKYAPLP